MPAVVSSSRQETTEEYAKSVLAGAPLVYGGIWVSRREHVRFVQHLTNLTKLRIQDHQTSNDLNWLRGAPCLASVNLMVGKPVQDLSPLREHQRLAQVWVQRAGIHGGFDVLRDLPDIENIFFSLTPEVRSVDFVNFVPGLRSLHLSNAVSVVDLEPVRTLTSLTDLSLPNGSLRDGLAGIRSILPQLSWLDISRNVVGDLSLLSEAVALEHVLLNNMDVTDVRPLTQLAALRRIHLIGCPEKLDLSPLEQLRRRAEIVLIRGRNYPGFDAIRRRHRIVRF